MNDNKGRCPTEYEFTYLTDEAEVRRCVLSKHPACVPHQVESRGGVNVSIVETVHPA